MNLITARRVVGVAVTLTLLVAGCSSDDPDEAAPTTTAAGTTTPPATSAPPPTTVPVALPTTFPAPTGPPCTAGERGALVVTVDCVDPDIAGAPFIDVDEQRTTTDPASGVTVEYRYVNGGFTDSPVRFSFYFPPAEAYEGRFFESTYPTVEEEDADPATVAFGIANGAYVVSSNNAGGVAASPVLGGYRANAAAAKFSRLLAAELYGADAPVRGYILGASGGAYQTVAAAENTDGVWQGAVPMVPGVPNAIPSFMSVQVLALRELAEDWPAIVDALEPGGSGDPYATLDDEERAILEEATRLGHPLGGWWQYETLRGGAFGFVASAVEGVDPSYVEDFFTVPGYEGTDPRVAALRVRLDTTIRSVDAGPPTTLTLADTPTGALDFVDLVVTSGDAAGTTVALVAIDGAEVTLPDGTDPQVAAALAAGDAVRVDNSFYLALSFFHRHQVPAPDQYGWDQYRGPDGTAVPAQRPVLVGQVLSQVFGGVADGDFNGRMIMLSSILDVQAFPWAADWYRGRVVERLDAETDDRFRLWYVDRADHQPPSTPEGYAHIVRYDGVVQQALLDLDAWVRDDVAPPPTSAYTVTEDNQVVLAASADERGGIQPVVTLAVGPGVSCDEDGGARAEVSAGEPVSLRLEATMPPRSGDIVRVEWDHTSTGEYPDGQTMTAPGPDLTVCATHVYDEPGTYFAVARVTANRSGDPDATFGLVQNLARVRIVVR